MIWSFSLCVKLLLYIHTKCNIIYTPSTFIYTTLFSYETTLVEGHTIKPKQHTLQFRTQRHVPKTGVMIIGLGGNNGTTCVAGAIANKHNISWQTKDGPQGANYWGSLLLASTTKIGIHATSGQPIYTPLSNMLPLLHPNDIVWGGWDINSMNLGDAMKRAKVLDYDLQRQLYPYMKDIVPLPSIYFPDFIAANQSERANNVITIGLTSSSLENNEEMEGITKKKKSTTTTTTTSKQELLEHIRNDISNFKITNTLESVIILWCANTERFSSIITGLNDTASNLLHSIATNEDEISPSTIFATASILEGCTFINGSPQNTFVPGVIDLAISRKVYIAGDDFKSGQTRMKTVMVDYLVSAGIKPVSIVSYNHLGNNDGMNLSSDAQFHSKEISKSNVIDDMVNSNHILYPNPTTDTPDHVVVIKYVPYVGDSKRAMDEYTSEIFLGGTNTIVMHNTCEDSLLATPLIYDLVILAELCQRVKIKKVNNDDNEEEEERRRGGEGGGIKLLPIDEKKCDGDEDNKEIMDKSDDDDNDEWESLHPVLSLLSYMLKAPVVPQGAPVVNALFTQRCAIVNFMRACLGLAPDNHMTLEHKFESMMFGSSGMSSSRSKKEKKMYH